LTIPDTPGISMSSAELPLPQPEACWLTAADGEQLLFRLWRGVQGQPVVVYFHGIEGHSRWFDQTAAYLNRLGMSVYVPDRRGAGANAQERGHLGGHKLFLSDMELMVSRARLDHPQAALFLVGNCWGAKGTIVLAAGAAAARYGIAGVALTSPAVAVRVDVSLATKLAIFAGWIIRSRHKFPIPLTAEMFTDNPRYLDFIARDRLRLTEATGCFFVASTVLTWLSSRCAARLRVPLLVLQSGRDQIVDVDGVRKWFDRVASGNKSMRLFPECEHSLDFDCRPDDYLAALSGWLSETAGRGA